MHDVIFPLSPFLFPLLRSLTQPTNALRAHNKPEQMIQVHRKDVGITVNQQKGWWLFTTSHWNNVVC